VTSGADSMFLGYTELTADGLSLRAWRHRLSDDGASSLELVLDRTPCYAESGGQVADRGTISGGGATATLEHVYKEGDRIVHRVVLTQGSRDALLAAGRDGGLSARVEAWHRAPVGRHHTATHLLHAALRRTLGEHVKQAGSLVAPDRLRFDYSHFESPSPSQVSEVETLVADWIRADREVRWELLPIAEAKARGAMALFGEKYGAEVRMVTVDGVPERGIAPSLELCGGTHVARTGEIGAFLVVSESAIAAGVRRLEARCGAEAIGYLRAQTLHTCEREVGEIRKLLVQIAELRGAGGEAAATWDDYVSTTQARVEAHRTQAGTLGAGVVVPQMRTELREMQEELVAKIEALKQELAALRKTHAEEARGGLEAEMTKLAAEAKESGGARWVVAQIRSEADANAVRDAADRMRGSLRRGAVVLALQANEKLTFLAAVTDDLVAEKKLNASDLVKRVAQVAGGSGGGKPHLALAGGKDLSKLDAALDEARRVLTEVLG
jgi:alanyl-tRNA synthetase